MHPAKADPAKVDSVKVDSAKVDSAKENCGFAVTGTAVTTEKRILWWSSVAKIKSASLRQNIDTINLEPLKEEIKAFIPLRQLETGEEYGLLVEFHYSSDSSCRVALRCLATHTDWNEILRMFMDTAKHGVLSGPFSYEDFVGGLVAARIHSCITVVGKNKQDLYLTLKEMAEAKQAE
jgi:hypothetical protein